MAKPTAKAIAARFIVLSELQSHCTAYLGNPTEEEADGIHRDRLSELLEFGLWKYVASTERKLLEKSPLALGFDLAKDAFFSMNAQAVLAWCLGMIDGLPTFDTAITDEDAPYSDEFFDHIPKPSHFELIASHFKLRPSRVIEAARTEAELWHWRSRTLDFQRSKPVAKSSTRSQFFQERVREATQSCVSDGIFKSIDEDFPAFGKPSILLDDDEWKKIRIITEQRHKALNWACGLAPGNNYDETPTNA